MEDQTKLIVRFISAMILFLFPITMIAYDLVGEWTLAYTDINGMTIIGNTNPTIIFRNDGTGSIQRYSFKWEVSGDYVSLKCKNGFLYLEQEKIIRFSIERQYGIDDNHLCLNYKNEEGKKYQYTIYKNGLSEAEEKEYLRASDKVFEAWKKQELARREREKKEKQEELERQRLKEKERQKQEMKKKLAPWQLLVPWWEYMKIE